MKSMERIRTVTLSALLAGLTLASGQLSAAPLALADSPLFITSGGTPLNMLVLGRDHKLYYEAYNDHSDLDEDGTLDVRFKPSITYFGYFASDVCYTHDGSKFNPASMATTIGTDLNACSSQWSGNFLNYLTTTRMDALRKVLYGGYRSTDGSTTVLERAYVPQDAHTWGKEYTNTATDGYDISHYAPYSQPSSGRRHLFANVTPLTNVGGGPLLRVLTSRSERIWEWVSTERAVAGKCLLTGQRTDGTTNCNGGATSVTPQDLIVRVSVCAAGFDQSSCKQYPNGTYKPVGLLQQYGESDSMKFGLISGSYRHNTDGGVLRKAASSIKNEINWSTNGSFISGANGIIQTLNNLKSTGFTQSNGYAYNCGWITTRPINDGECQMWGNPVAEMMYEGMRYFAGKSAPTTAYKINAGDGEESGLNLPVASWTSSTDPYLAANGNGTCAKPVETVISDVNTSYDTDKLPGIDSNFGSFSDTFSSASGVALNVSSVGQQVWNNEFGAGSKSIFIGQVGATADSAPTVKTANSFGNIRGLAPEEPTKQGGYYASSISLFGHNNDLNVATGSQKLSTFAVALASPLPQIDINVNGKIIKIMPFAKSVGDSNGAYAGSFRATNQIVDFYVETFTPTSGRFRVNFEDVEQGADHDMDAIVLYDYTVNTATNTLTVTLTSQYAAGGITQHVGYVISGSNADGIYLDVRDRDTDGTCGNNVDCPARDVNYSLDTPNIASALPLTKTRTFQPGSSAGADLLKDPLWYAAKYGAFNDLNENGLPDTSASGPSPEWDTDGDGDPDNYFLVTNALTLGPKLAAAFNEIMKKVSSASAATVNSGSVSQESRVYQAKFSSADWTGNILSYKVDGAGALASTAEWGAADALPNPSSRNIWTVGSESSFTPKKFDWTTISADSTRKSQLGSTDTLAQEVLNYLRGDDTGELDGTYRVRSTKLGDIVNSAPLFVGQPSAGYDFNGYSAFASLHKNRAKVVYAGANDGMLHAFDTDSNGGELFAFIPSPVFANLKDLSSKTYSHKYYVDGSPSSDDAYFNGAWHTVLVGGLNKGGQGIYALDVTTPDSFSSSDVLWEFTDKNDRDLGYTFSQPIITKTSSGTWVAIFGNGYNNSNADTYTSTTGRAVLYIVDLSNGQLIRKIDTLVGSTATPNGLASAAVVDFNVDDVADYVYAGDLRGNMWKFDITSTNPSNWKVAYTTGSGAPMPLYVATDASGNAQPITTRPEVYWGPNGQGMTILFGTGKWLELTDKVINTARPQTFYGVYDFNTGTSSDAFTGRTNLAMQTIVSESTQMNTDGSTTSIRKTSANSAGSKGWYLDLIPPSGTYAGERSVSNPVLRNGRVLFSTLIPSSDPCSYGGDSWIMSLAAITGSSSNSKIFDTNHDGKIDQDDVESSGVLSTVGATDSPALLNVNTNDMAYGSGAGGDMENRATKGRRMGRQSWLPLK